MASMDTKNDRDNILQGLVNLQTANILASATRQTRRSTLDNENSRSSFREGALFGESFWTYIDDDPL